MIVSQICSEIIAESWTIVDDPVMNEPYAFNPNTNIWCSYDHQQSVTLKVMLSKRNIAKILSSDCNRAIVAIDMNRAD